MQFESMLSSQAQVKLATLRRNLRGHLLGKGLSWLVMALVCAVLLSLLIDKGLQMDRAQRVLISGLALVGLAAVLWRYTLRPMGVPMDLEELALVMEKYNPGLRDRLISSLQFSSRATSRIGGSEELIQRVAQETNELLAGLDPTSPLNPTPTYRRLMLALTAVVVLGGVTTWRPDVMKLWFQRNVLFANIDWPKDTYLSIQGGPNFKVVRGGELKIAVRADAKYVVPENVAFHMSFSGVGGNVSEVIGPDAGTPNSFTKTFDNVTEGFTFYVTGNDDQTPKCFVVTVDPPELVDVAFSIVDPGYMNPELKARSATAAYGVLPVSAGSQIYIAGKSSKALIGAQVLLDGKLTGTARPLPDGTGAMTKLDARVDLPEIIKVPTMSLQFRLVAEDSVNDRGASYALRIDPDRPPKVTMTRAGIRGEVTAKAMIPLTLEAEDDRGLAVLNVAVATISTSTQPSTQPTTQSAGAASQPAVRSAVVAVPGIERGQLKATVEYVLDLQKLLDERKITEPWRAGEIISVQANVTDNRPDNFGGANAGQSPVQTFKIVSEEDLMEQLTRKQAEIAQDFSQVVLLQAMTRDRMATAADRARKDGVEVASFDIRKAVADQRAIVAGCQAAAAQYLEVFQEMNNNRIGDAGEKAKMYDKVILPLREISKKPMEDAIAVMDKAAGGTDVAAMADVCTRMTGNLNVFYERLQEVLKEMKEGQSRQELANRLKRLITSSEEILKAMQNKPGASNPLGPASKPALPGL